MSRIADQEAHKMTRWEPDALGFVIQGGITGAHSGLKCPYKECGCGDLTHVVDAVWETDPSMGDRRWVRMEVRCEMGRGYLLLIRNHGGYTRFDYRLIEGELSPFAEGMSW